MICMFSYSILMWLSMYSVLSGNSCIDQELSKLLGHIFPTLVISQSFDFMAHKVFNICLVPSECQKTFRLFMEEDNYQEVCSSINEGHPVSVTLWTADRERTMKVRVNKC